MKDITILTDADVLLYLKELKEIKNHKKLLSAKWVKSLLLAIHKGKKCHKDLKNGLIINGKKISPKVISKLLALCLAEGLIILVDSATSECQGDYQLKAEGKKAVAVIQFENKFAEEHELFMIAKKAKEIV